jgi:hypothetical protein
MSGRRGRVIVRAAALAACVMTARPAFAHSGPPYPLASDRIAGPYRVSIWTDPDTTDDRAPGGRFWVTMHPAREGAALPAGTFATVSIQPADRPGPAERARGDILDQDVSRQYAALPMDHEGPFTVRIVIDGPLGQGTIEASVQATYDLRPAPVLLLLYVMPFALAGFLWIKLLLRRRRLVSPKPSGGG